ncbi:MAG: SRPBCC family protein [Nitriliruptorales bacterium]|nr:SRPBCC family protein [Nitriliruptorales bacterium]
MGYAHLTKHIEALPDEVFDFAAQARRLPEWLTLIIDVAQADDRLDHEGASFASTMKLGGRQLEVDWHVTRAEPGHHVHLDGTADPDGTASAVFQFGRWEGGTEVMVEIDWQLPGGFVANLTDRLFVERAIARELKHSLANLADIVEVHETS